MALCHAIEHIYLLLQTLEPGGTGEEEVGTVDSHLLLKALQMGNVF